MKQLVIPLFSFLFFSFSIFWCPHVLPYIIEIFYYHLNLFLLLYLLPPNSLPPINHALSLHACKFCKVGSFCKHCESKIKIMSCKYYESIISIINFIFGENNISSFLLVDDFFKV